MLERFKKIWTLLTIGENKGLYGLIVMIILMSLLDIVGIASIFPFLSVISNPEVIQTNSKLKWLYDNMGFTDDSHFFMALGMASFVILLASNSFRAMTMIALLRFTWLKHHIISTRLLSQYLYEPYVFFLNRNSSELTAYLISEVARVVSSTLIPFMQLMARVLLALLTLGLLMIVDPVVATMVLLLIGGGYAVIYMFCRKRLSRSGEELMEHSKKMYKSLNEAFGGIKDIKILGTEEKFIEGYSDPTKKIIRCYSSQFLISQFPRYAFEVLGFGGILLITICLIRVKNDYQQIIPLIGLYAFAAYRLLPALHQIFSDITSMRFGRATLDKIYHNYFNCSHGGEKKQLGPTQALPFLGKIEFQNVTFQYPKAQKSVLKNLSLIVKANTTVGFVGDTGAGKTTIIDVLLGLLRPQQGTITVDGTVLTTENLRGWQANIGYVPQNIYLCDDTITRNIAFGIRDDEIDHKAVERAARLANIHDFVTQELSHKYETEVGERGIRLSGGQKQRIGIARALYHDPLLLVFDEATSALDGITEDAILDSVHNLTHKKTIVFIAHRLSTVKECDVIYMLEQGKIFDQGTYEELLAGNQQFRKMAKA